jgi:hypothetical protein
VRQKTFSSNCPIFEGPIWVRGGTFALVARDSSNAKRKARHQNSQTSKQQGIKTARQQNRRWQLALGGLVEQRFELA